jgi:hypothetical protein
MVPTAARPDAVQAPVNRPGGSGVVGGVALLLLTLPCLVGLFAAFEAEQHKPSVAAWAAGLVGFLLLASVWLVWAGIVLVARRRTGALLVPGIVGLVAATVGLLVVVPRALTAGRGAEEYFESRLLLFVIATVGAAAAGNVLAARGSSAGRVLHWLSPLGMLGGIAYLAYLIVTYG